MFTMVFSNEDKQKLIATGAKFMCEQKMGQEIAYLFSGNININFEENKIKYKRTNKLNF